MKTLKATRTIKIPDDVTVSVKGRHVSVTGPRGTLSRDFGHIVVHLRSIHKGRQIVADMWHADRKRSACLRTVVSHITNLITGVTKGYRYKMRLVYAHFPINTSVEEEGKVLEIRNFLGERVVRRVSMLGDVTVSRNDAVKDELWVEGSNVDDVSQSAANIHQSCLVKNKDIRKFLDGVYVSEKTTIVQEE